MTPAIEYAWRGDISDAELVELTDSYGGNSQAGWWDRIRPFSLGWVSGRVRTGDAVAFVNVAWDGGDHAFLIDTKVRLDLQRQGIGTELVRIATEHTRTAGCEWLHVDYDDRERLEAFLRRSVRVSPHIRGGHPSAPPGITVTHHRLAEILGQPLAWSVEVPVAIDLRSHWGSPE